MDNFVTVFRSADPDAEEDARHVMELLSNVSIVATLANDEAPGVPEGTWEVRVSPSDSAAAEALVAANPPEDEFENPDESSELDMVTVFQSGGTTGEMEAMSVKAMLESNGIEAMIVADSRFPNLGEEVRVPREHVSEAKTLIQAALEAGPAGAAEAEAGTEGESIS
jgi:hypothetical protein